MIFEEPSFTMSTTVSPGIADLVAGASFIEKRAAGLMSIHRAGAQHAAFASVDTLPSLSNVCCDI
jgi:hypothetical protein